MICTYTGIQNSTSRQSLYRCLCNDVYIAQILELKELVKDLKIQSKPEESESLSLDEALKYINVKGLEIKKSTIYKMVSSGTIPYRKICGRLIFYRDEIDLWFDCKLQDKSQMIAHARAEVIKSAQTKFSS